MRATTRPTCPEMELSVIVCMGCLRLHLLLLLTHANVVGICHYRRPKLNGGEGDLATFVWLCTPPWPHLPASPDTDPYLCLP